MTKQHTVKNLTINYEKEKISTEKRKILKYHII